MSGNTTAAVYTCNTCLISFSNSQDQREHMKGDWHRYNLKRRVAQLPPINEDIFNNKVSTLGSKPAEDDTAVKKNKTLTKKEMRRLEKEKLLEKKKKLLELAKQNMLANMKKEGVDPSTLVAEAPQEDRSEEVPEVQEVLEVQEVTEVPEVPEVPEVQEETSEAKVVDELADNMETLKVENVPDEELSEEQLAEKLMAEKLANKVEIPLNQCLFCTKKTVFETFEENLEHMFSNHGFYIPEQKYLVNKEGLVKYLSEKVGFGNICLCCSYQGRSLQAVQAHMLMKRHCKIPYESENEKLEISDFYDFSSTYSGFASTKKSKKQAKEEQNENNEEEEEDNEEWEDVDEEEVDDNEDIEVVEEYENKKDGSNKVENDEDEDEEEDMPEEYLYSDGTNLHLPTGVKIGHRSMQRYYKQVAKPERVLTEGQGTVIAAETRHFVALLDKQEVQAEKRAWQSEIKDKKRDDKRRAKYINFQPHYRDQLLQ